MKILFIASFPPPYHGGNVDNDHIVSHWCSPKTTLIPFDISHKRRTGKTIGKLTGLNIFKGIIHVLKLFSHLLFNRSYDAILMSLSQGTWGFIRDGLLILIARINNQKIICRFPGGDFIKFYDTSRLRPFIKLIIKQIDKVITEGESVNSQFLEINPSARVQSVHIGIPDYNKNPNSRSSDCFEVLYICNHRKEKGFWDVLLSVKPIIKGNQNILFDFVGELRLTEDEIRYVENYITQEDLTNFVSLPGILTGQDKWDAYKNASIQILPSYSEGMPTSIIEGLSFGLPIIASKVGVIPEIIKNYKNGFLITPGDTEDLINRIIKLSRNPDLVRKMGEINRKYFLEEYTIQKFNRRIEKAIIGLYF